MELCMKRTIKTKQQMKWKWIDRLAWLIPLIIFLLLINNGFAAGLDQVLEYNPPRQAFAVYLLLLFLTSLVFSMPLFFIWKTVSGQIRKGYKKRSTIPLLQELDYYREKLTGLSPTLISMLVDFKIEPKKDAAALILKYELMNVISTENGHIEIKDKNHPDLMPSDRELLNQIGSLGNMPDSITTNAKWLTMAKQEAVNTPFFQQKPANKECASCLVTGCLIPFLLFFGVPVLIFISSMFGWTQYISDVLDSNIDEARLVELFLTDSVFMGQLLWFLFLAVLLFVAFFQPFLSILRLIVNGYNIYAQNGLQRTAEGEQISEYIYGMKNFIHDFSNLSEATQDSLILWDDFLIYAVILEENEKVVNQIINKSRVNQPPFNS